MKALFAGQESKIIDEEQRVERLMFINNLYQKWIHYKRNQKGKQSKLAAMDSIFDIICCELCDNYNMQTFLSDYRFVVNTKRTSMGYNDDNDDDTKKEEDSDCFCEIDCCFITKRNERNKGSMTTNNGIRNEIFFVNSKLNKDSTETIKDIVIQQILDTLHLWTYHSLKLDANKYLIHDINHKDKEENDDNESDIDLNELCYDSAVKKLGDIIKKKQKSSKRFRATMDSRYSSNNNKFITSKYNENADNTLNAEDDGVSDNNLLAMYQFAVYGNDQLLLQKEKKDKKKQMKQVKSGDGECWFDDLLKEMVRYKLSESFIEKVWTFTSEQEYESESLYADLSNDEQSNIIKSFAVKNGVENGDALKLYQLLTRFRFETDRDNNVYAEGWKYFYWSFYKNNEAEWNELFEDPASGKPELEGNAGYSLSGWYIPSKYRDFKEELLNNKNCCFSLEQYMDSLEVATQKRLNWMNDPDVEPLKCFDPNGWRERCYGIKHDDLISVEHLMAIIFYCNYSVHCTSFSSTYRRNNKYESDESLKLRHSEHHFWGKLLVECITCFGIQMVYSSIPLFYHGVSKSMLFNSTTIRLNGPLSTTRGVFICLLFYILYILALILYMFSFINRFYNRMVHIWFRWNCFGH